MHKDFKYRQEIDGLRAFAVMPVILYHAGVQQFQGGYVGVDVFFVISGYLITTLIISELEIERFSIWNFYQRRIRRIFPALFFVSLCCVPFAILWMLPNHLRALGNSIITLFLLSSNSWFAREIGYFEIAVNEYPLMHTWSLAVEEQFYLIFPIFLLTVWKFFRHHLFAILIAMAVLSFAFAEWGWRHNPETTFYLLHSRAWELLLGSLVALYLNKTELANANVNNLLSLIGFLLLAGSVYVFDDNTPFPSVYALVPTLGAALIILFAKSGTLVNSILSIPLFVGVGLISYSAYLWHVPLLAFLHITSLKEPTSVATTLTALGSLPFAWLTWKFIEQPFRNKTLFRGRTIVALYVLLTVFMLALGLVLRLESSFLSIPNTTANAKFTESNIIMAPNYERCNSSDSNFIPPAEACVFGNPKNEQVALVGDSHANSLAEELGKAFNNRNMGMRVLVSAACLPIHTLRRYGPHQTSCDSYNSQVVEYLSQHPEIKTVVLAGRWTLGLEGVGFDNQEGGLEKRSRSYVLPENAADSFVVSDERVAVVSRAFAEGVKSFLDLGKRVILIYPIPEVGWNVTEYLVLEEMKGVKRTGPLSTSLEVFNKRNKNLYDAFDSVGENKNLIRVYPSRVLCSTTLIGRCLAQIGKVPLYFDDNHLNNIGAKLIVDEILKALDK